MIHTRIMISSTRLLSLKPWLRILDRKVLLGPLGADAGLSIGQRVVWERQIFSCGMIRAEEVCLALICRGVRVIVVRGDVMTDMSPRRAGSQIAARGRWTWCDCRQQKLAGRYRLHSGVLTHRHIVTLEVLDLEASVLRSVQRGAKGIQRIFKDDARSVTLTDAFRFDAVVAGWSFFATFDASFPTSYKLFQPDEERFPTTRITAVTYSGIQFWCVCEPSRDLGL